MLKLYIREPNSPDAVASVQRAGEPLIFTQLHRLEMLGAIRCNVTRGTITAESAARAVKILRHDLKMGVFEFPASDWHRVFDRALCLSRRYSRSQLARSLDLLHIACALELEVPIFLSFDHRQRYAARAVGLNVLP